MPTERRNGARATSAHRRADAECLAGLPPGHDCRHDDPRYPDLPAWWVDHHGQVPIQMAMALSRAIREQGLSFGEAFTRLIDAGDIGLVHIPVGVPRNESADPPHERRVCRAAIVSVRAAHPENVAEARRRSGRPEGR